jgi:hypothetical protein
LGIDASFYFANATSVEAQADLFGHSLMELFPEIMPVQLKQIQAAQQQDSSLLSSSSDSPTFHIKSFCGGGKCRQLILYKDKLSYQNLSRNKWLIGIMRFYVIQG